MHTDNIMPTQFDPLTTDATTEVVSEIIKPSYMIMLFTGSMVWPTGFAAAGVMGFLQDCLKRNQCNIDYMDDYLALPILLGPFLAIAMAAWALKAMQDKPKTVTTTILAYSAIILLGLWGVGLLGIIFLQLFAFIPATIASFFLGAIVMVVLENFQLKSWLAFGSGGALCGAVVAGLVVAGDRSVGLSLDFFAFWIVGGALAMLITWIHWQYRLYLASH